MLRRGGCRSFKLGPDVVTYDAAFKLATCQQSALRELKTYRAVKVVIKPLLPLKRLFYVYTLSNTHTGKEAVFLGLMLTYRCLDFDETFNRVPKIGQSFAWHVPV